MLCFSKTLERYSIVNLDLPDALPIGLYFIVATTKNGEYTARMVKE
jgi:hypothetical protein